VAFERPHDAFARKLFGCPSVGEISHETCKPSLSEFDYAAFRKAREAAKTLYGLRDAE
jgi:hypothetical protein